MKAHSSENQQHQAPSVHMMPAELQCDLMVAVEGGGYQLEDAELEKYTSRHKPPTGSLASLSVMVDVFTV